jgi:ABC-type phosphate transport system substrate-binding protein
MGIVRHLWSLLLGTTLWAETIVVAVNPLSPIEQLTQQTITALYLDKRRTLQGHRVILLNLAFDHPLRRLFEEKILHKSREELERYWLRAHFKGHQPPKVVKSQEAAARFLEKIPYAIGYMEASIAKEHGLKIVYRWTP